MSVTHEKPTHEKLVRLLTLDACPRSAHPELRRMLPNQMGPTASGGDEAQTLRVVVGRTVGFARMTARKP